MNVLASGEIHGVSRGVLRLVPSEVDDRTSIHRNWYLLPCNVFCMVHTVHDLEGHIGQVWPQAGARFWSSFAFCTVSVLSKGRVQNINFH